MDKDLFRNKLQKKIAKVKNDLDQLNFEVDNAEYINETIISEEYDYIKATLDAFNEVLRMLEE